VRERAVQVVIIMPWKALREFIAKHCRVQQASPWSTWMAPSPDITGLCFTQRMPGFSHPFSADFKRMVYEMFA
jgi:hypothetical protein